jgi:TonB-dependent receptor
MKSIFTIIFLFFGVIMFGQSGTVRGTVIDNITGEPMLGVTVIIKGTTIGTITDLDGQYSIDCDAGTIALQFSYISYQTITLEGIEVKEKEVKVVENIKMMEDAIEAGEVVVTAEAIKSNEAGIITMKLKSAGMIDGISSDKIRQTGDANVAEATKRVTGVSVEGGKYVYVRGLGDRYSKTMLNGVDIPGLDPDRNSLQMDIFPTNLISNIVISKNFTAELPADFTGGLLNIETKDFPEEKIINLSFSTAYNPQMHFNKNYLTYAGGKTDFLGFDDGTRALPAGADKPQVPSPGGYSTQQIRDFNAKFNPTLGAVNQLSLLDLNAGFSIGNQIALKKNGEATDNKLGYIFSLSYKSDYKYYDDVQYGEYQREPDVNAYQMVYSTKQSGQLAERSFLLGGIAGLAYKTRTSKVKLTLLHLQNGESRVGRFVIDNNSSTAGQSGYGAKSDNLEYNQRSLSNILLSGTHNIVGKGWEIDWRTSGTYSTSKDPDIRKTAFSGYDFTENDSTFRFASGEAGYPSRIWRSLSELNATAKIDISKKIKINARDLKIKFGTSYTYKTRDYQILTYELRFGQTQYWNSSDANQVYGPRNFYLSDTNSFYIVSGNNFPNPNEYNSNVQNLGAYFSGEYSFWNRLKVIAGLRTEYFVQRHTGRDIDFAQGKPNGNNLVNEKVLETINFFPTVNLVYNVTPKMNIRTAYARTIARPSFKELSYAQILDPITNRTFNGSLFSFKNDSNQITWSGNLVETNIDNVDLRWEWFFQNNQLISLSGFFKNFTNPIELVRIPSQQTGSDFQPRNVGNGMVLGLEIELRKDFSFISEVLKDLSFNTNITLVKSMIRMTDVEFNSRKSYEKEGQNITNIRDMAGQSPFVINAGISYNNSALGFETGIFYNVKGPTLSVVGTGLLPDVYDEPFHSLNFSFSKKFGKNKNTALDFRVSNMLNDRIESFYTSFKADKQVFNSINPGVTFSLGFNHKF